MDALRSLVSGLASKLPAQMQAAPFSSSSSSSSSSSALSERGASDMLEQTDVESGLSKDDQSHTGNGYLPPVQVQEDDVDDDDDYANLIFKVPCTERVNLPEYPCTPETFVLLRLRNYTNSDISHQSIAAANATPPSSRPLNSESIEINDSEQAAAENGDYLFVVAYNECSIFEMFLKRFVCTRVPHDLRAVLGYIDLAYRTGEIRPLCLAYTPLHEIDVTEVSVLLQQTLEKSRPNTKMGQSAMLLSDVLVRFTTTYVVTPQLIAVFRYWLWTGGPGDGAIRQATMHIQNGIECMEHVISHSKRLLSAIENASINVKNP